MRNFGEHYSDSRMRFSTLLRDGLHSGEPLLIEVSRMLLMHQFKAEDTLFNVPTHLLNKKTLTDLVENGDMGSERSPLLLHSSVTASAFRAFLVAWCPE